MIVSNIIIGKRSYLSSNLKTNFNCFDVISLNNFDKEKFKKKYQNSKINLIINHFYPIYKINTKNSKIFYIESVKEILSFLNYIKDYNINKIILSSSSAIYGRNARKLDFNRSDYGKAKYKCEQIVKKFCKKQKCFYSICRIFNMYGEKDKSSVIFKIISAIKNKKKFKLVNNGDSERDFINVQDVSEIYVKLLSINKSEIIDIGTGKSTKIKDIIDIVLPSNIEIIYAKNMIKELPNSIAKKNIQLSRLKKKKFIKIENFLKNKFL
jgi:nucleoside-diphosphate-sugar epimerase